MRYLGREIEEGPIDEWIYEDFIDIAYGRGENLRNTKLWDERYDRGFVCPDENGRWLAFAYDGKRYLFLGDFSFDDTFGPDEEDWYEYEDRMFRKADSLPAPEAINVLRELYLDPRNGETTPEGIRIANDPACVEWIADYWTYIRWNEHGNECSLSEVGFGGFAEDIRYPMRATEYLEYGYPDCDPRGTALSNRLMELHRKHFGGSR